MRRVRRVATALSVISLCAAGAATAQTITLAPVGSIVVPAEFIRIQGDRAYLAAGMILSIYDISLPASPKSIGSYTFPDRIWGFRVVGSLAYVGVDRSGLGILDVSKGTPVLRSLFKTPGQAKNVAVSGTRALVTDSLKGIDVVDVSDSAKPVLAGDVFLDGLATDVVTSGTMAYAADRPTGFYVLDLSKVGPLEPVGTLQTAAANNTMRAQLEVLSPSTKGQRRVLLVAGGLLQQFDVTKPESPTKLPPFATPGGAQRVAIKDWIVYVADGQAGVQVVDLSGPDGPKIVGSFKTSSPARDIAVSASHIFVALASGEVAILQQSP